MISIGLPFYNPGRYLEGAVRSIFAQTVSDWELFLVNDGSTDGSLEWCNRIQDPRVRVINDGLNKGLSPRLNQISRLANGTILVRMDADDLMHPERLAVIIQSLPPNDNHTVLGSLAYSIDANDNPYGYREPCVNDTGWGARHRFIHPTVASTTTWFQENPYSEDSRYRRGEDAELWLRTRPHTKRIVISKPLLYYREIGVYSHSNYKGTAKGMWHLAEHYSPNILTMMQIRSSIIAKVITMKSLDLICMADVFIKRRSSTLSAHQREDATKGLNAIKTAFIPGIDRAI